MKLLMSLFFVLAFSILNAQIYETEDLRIQAEKNFSKKHKVTETKEVLSEETKEELAESLLMQCYTLMAIEAKDYSAKHTVEEMKSFSNEMAEEFNNTDIRITYDLDKMYFINKNNRKEHSVKDILEKDNILDYVNCIKCNNDPFTIVVNSNDDFVIETPAQDAGQYFVVRLIFKK